MTLVSVCIPTYNGEEYLGECLTSTIRQTFQNLEIIVCDDGSSDRTLDIANQFAQADRRLVIHRNAARLKGFRATGIDAWIWLREGGSSSWARTDDPADDCIEVMVRAVDQTGRMVVCDRQIAYQDVDHRFQEDFTNSYVAETPLHKVGERPELSKQRTSRGFVRGSTEYDNFIGEPVFTLFPHDVIKDVGYFDDRFVLWSDYEMWSPNSREPWTPLVARPARYLPLSQQGSEPDELR